MLTQFNNMSRWLRHDIKIKKHELYTLEFIDSNPNYFAITNPNMARLKIGISTLPRVDSFEFKVEYNTTETLGRPHGTHKLYILNDSDLEINVIVFSAEHEFDPEILKNLNVGLEGYTIETSTKIGGVQAGVTLPVQDSNTLEFMDKLMSNNVSVDFLNLAGLLVPINKLINENKVNGATNLATLSERLGNITDLANQLISNAGVDGKTNLHNLYYTMVKMLSTETQEGMINLYDLMYQLYDISRTMKKNVIHRSGTRTPVDTTQTFISTEIEGRYISKIDCIRNDLDVDITLSLYNRNEETTQLFTLKAGEMLTNFECDLNAVSFSPVTNPTGGTIEYILTYKEL